MVLKLRDLATSLWLFSLILQQNLGYIYWRVLTPNTPKRLHMILRCVVAQVKPFPSNLQDIRTHAPSASWRFPRDNLLLRVIVPAAPVQPFRRPGANPASYGDEIRSTRPVLLFAASNYVFRDAILASKAGDEMFAVAASARDDVVAKRNVAAAVAPGPESQRSAGCGRGSMGPETKQDKNINTGLKEMHILVSLLRFVRVMNCCFTSCRLRLGLGPLYAYLGTYSPESLAYLRETWPRWIM